MKKQFELVSEFEPAGDQHCDSVAGWGDKTNGRRCGQNPIRGNWDSGKNPSPANVAQAVQRPVDVSGLIKHVRHSLQLNLKEFFPKQCVEYFVSYYDYSLSAEAYVASSDTFIR